MATVLYATMMITPGQVETAKRYLYDSAEIVATAMVERFDDGGADLCWLIIRTEAQDAERAEYLQQYQADRLASGMLGMTIRFESRAAAERHALERTEANGWGLRTWHPGSALISAK